MGTRRSLAPTPGDTPRVGLRASFAALATRTREGSPGRPEPYARAYAEPAAELGLRTFWLGVTGCTTAVAVFLLARLTAWPPHEDETLAAFVGGGAPTRPPARGRAAGALRRARVAHRALQDRADRARGRAAPLSLCLDRGAPG